MSLYLLSTLLLIYIYIYISTFLKVLVSIGTFPTFLSKSKLWEIVKDREAWHPCSPRVTTRRM